jgi:pimeloyl-ACP methyl ester carboxylesterase
MVAFLFFAPMSVFAMHQNGNGYSAFNEDAWNNSDPMGLITIGFEGFGMYGDTKKKGGLKQRGLIDAEGNPRSRVLQHNQHSIAIKKIKHALEKNPNQPVILIGHSWGADSAIEVANKLKKLGIKVDLLIQIDSVGAGDATLPDNVEQGINYQGKKSNFPSEGDVTGSENKKYGTGHMDWFDDPNLITDIKSKIGNTVKKGKYANTGSKNPCD